MCGTVFQLSTPLRVAVFPLRADGDVRPPTLLELCVCLFSTPKSKKGESRWGCHASKLSLFFLSLSSLKKGAGAENVCVNA
jgi:hypothetical protein